MSTPKDVLVVTTSSLDGIKIKKYLKPVSAHIVAGTNLFSDFMGGLSDIFGGRSETYQKQLISLYDEAITRIKYAAYEVGSNCILGLNIDMDEISGKGKSMFMLTAVGTAVIIEKDNVATKPVQQQSEKFENVAVDRINSLRSKKAILEKANSGKLSINEETWGFITSNQVHELFPYLLKKFGDAFAEDRTAPGVFDSFYRSFIVYLEALPEDKRYSLLYNGIKKLVNDQLALSLSDIIRDLQLYDFNLVMDLLKSDDFSIKKRGLRIVTYDKPFFNKHDKDDLQTLREFIKSSFIERGKRTTKKQLLSSKEKEVWLCECGKTNDVDTYCSGCYKDIYGFLDNEFKPLQVDSYIQKKMEMISEFLD